MDGMDDSAGADCSIKYPNRGNTDEMRSVEDDIKMCFTPLGRAIFPFGWIDGRLLVSESEYDLKSELV